MTAGLSEAMTLDAVATLGQDALAAVRSMQFFDVQQPEDLYKLFFFCHMFSWLVVMWKLRN